MTTAIETYLNSLPKNVLTIDISCKGLTSLPDLTRFKNLQELYCTNNKLTSLPTLPQNLTKLYCSKNELTLLPTLPQNLKELYCYKNKLTSLPTLPQKLTKLYCYNNQLTYLPTLPQNLKELDCYNNKLTYLPTLPQNLEKLDCSVNKLTYLPTLPENLEKLYCYNNQLTYLPILPQNLKELRCSENQLTSLPTLPTQSLLELYYVNNPIYEIINNNRMIQINKNIKILNNFRHLYYCLKFKKQLRNYWLWEKVREPIIMKKYHPKYLIENLGDEDDLDAVLDNWK